MKGVMEDTEEIVEIREILGVPGRAKLEVGEDKTRF